MTMDSNDNKTVGLPPNMANGLLRKPARPGGPPEAPPAAKVPPSAPPERKPTPERPPADSPKHIFGLHKPAATPAPAQSPQRVPENPWMTIPPPSPNLKNGQLPPSPKVADIPDDSSFFGPGAGFPALNPHADPVREVPATAEHRPESRPEAYRQPPTPAKAPTPARKPEREMPGTQTIAVPGKGIGAEQLAEGKLIAVKILTKEAGWQPLVSIRVDSQGQVIGRCLPDLSGPDYASMAQQHFRLTWADGRLQIQEMKTINGVFIRLAKNVKVPLTDGSRFKIGPHVLEFRPHADTGSANTPATGPDGEVFRSVAVKPLAYLDVLGPNAKPSLRIPLTKPDFTDIGRLGGEISDVVLSEDTEISRQHARIHCKDGQFFLEDKSANGTYVRLQGKRAIALGTARNENLGDTILVGDLYLLCAEI